MLSYQHIFHAGNHADILKHSVLMFVLDSLNKKDKPYTFFDTHSGSGLYDLKDNRSLKTGEAQKGIELISKLAGGGEGGAGSVLLPSALTRYLDFVCAYLKDGRYPGSPEIERILMRQSDTLILSELHPQEIENLRENMKRPGTGADQHASAGTHSFPSIQIHKRSGWEMLKALTPPATKRGAVLIDPSYEEASDYEDAADTICAVHKKWSNGIIMLWYPMLAHREGEIEAMLDRITEGARAGNPNIEIADLRLEVFDKNAHKEVSLEEYRAASSSEADGTIKNPPRLYGSGMLVLNSPWKLEEEVWAEICFIKNEF